MLTNRIRNKINRTFIDASFLIGLESFLYKNKKGAAIIMYHGVDLFENKYFNLRHVGKDNFEKQIVWLKKYCNIISIDDYFQGRLNPEKFNVAITFDDGYENNYKYAFPILEKHQIKATFYITGLNHTEQKMIWGDTNNFIQKLYPKKELIIEGRQFVKQDGDFLDSISNQPLSYFCRHSDYSFKEELNKVLFSNVDMGKVEFFDYWKLMTDEQIRMIGNSDFVSVGSHGWYHNNLGNINVTKARKEVQSSKEYLENLVQKPILSIAYPDGNYSEDVKEAATSLGFTQQLATENYLFENDCNDANIRSRYGVYPAFSWCNQLDQMF